MIVKNVSGTAGLSCSCGTWLDHWRKFSGQSAGVCGTLACSKTDVVGAHVRLIGDFTTYIYPLCSSCNQATGELIVWDGYKLIPANKAETCEKSQSKSFFSGRYS